MDHHPVQQFCRVLVEFNRASCTGADLLTAIQKAGAEVPNQTPDDNALGAAVDPLGCQTRKAGERFGNTGVRQLADVLGGDCFNDDRSTAFDLG